jgi:carboxyl-terminal processing protease
MNKKISLGAALALMFVITAVTFSITMIFSRQMFSTTVTNISQREAMYDKLSEIDSYVRKNYYGTIDEKNLNDYLAAGYVAGLSDRYATYYTASDYAKKQQENAGKLTGIGIRASRSESGFIQVNEVYPDSPASEAGIKAGDLIVKVNDIDVTAETYESAISEIGGKAGTKVSMTVRSDNKDREISEITRRVVVTPTVYSRMIGNAGYIKIVDFNENTYDQFKKAVEDLIGNNKAESLIFDLRNNTGGLVDPAIKMLDMLLPEGTIATATYHDGSSEVLGVSDANCVEKPMVVLTNENTASAAELFTQALRDYGVAKSVGSTTYGKGVMQVTHSLKDGSAIRITVAQYNPPKSPNYDGIGIKPDYEVSLTEDQQKNFDQLDETNDPQLMKALEIIRSTPVSTQPSVETIGDSGTSAPEETESEEPSSEESSESEEATEQE